MFREPEQPVYYYNGYWQIWTQIVGYDNETGVITLKDLEDLHNGSGEPHPHYLKEYDFIYGRLKKNNLCLDVVNREDYRRYNGHDFKDFKNEIIKTSGEAFKYLRRIHVPLTKFEFDR